MRNLARSAALTVVVALGLGFSWNDIPAFTEAARPFCTVELPDNAGADIQISAENVVSAIRTMSDEAGRTVDVVGHSQGRMIPRWGLKYWPDLRDKVDDVIGLVPSNHGTVVANGVCAVGRCSPAIQQQRVGSEFLTALNAGRETYDEVDDTAVSTDFDEVVMPNVMLPPGVPPEGLPDAAPPASSALRDGGDNVTNVSLQSICLARPADHLTTGTSDAVGYALVIDALDHDGAADPVWIDRSVCLSRSSPASTRSPSRPTSRSCSRRPGSSSRWARGCCGSLRCRSTRASPENPRCEAWT